MEGNYKIIPNVVEFGLAQPRTWIGAHSAVQEGVRTIHREIDSLVLLGHEMSQIRLGGPGKFEAVDAFGMPTVLHFLDQSL